MIANYPERRKQLNGLMAGLAHETPGPLSAFGQLHKASTATGALDAKTKELMALAIAVAQRCENCIAFHVHDALAAGASRAELVEALGVAVMMGGGPAAMYACEAFEALRQYEAEAASR